MAIEVGLASCLIGTNGTRVGLFTRVGPYVSLKDVLMRGTIGTERARERPLACMGVDVFFKEGVACSTV